MNTGPYADIMRDLELIAQGAHRHTPPRRSRPPARPLTKSLADMGRDLDRMAADLAKRQADGWLSRIQGGCPTEDDLLKAHAVLDGAVGQIPARDLIAADAKLRALHTTRPMTKSMTPGFSLTKARAQLDGLFTMGKITGQAYRQADFHLRQLETAHGA